MSIIKCTVIILQILILSTTCVRCANTSCWLPMIRNTGKIQCDQPTHCEVTCSDGYKFRDGSTKTTFECNNNIWSPTISDCTTLQNCAWNGKTFVDGSEVKQNCQPCRCDNGAWMCTGEACRGVCSAFGDPHYTSFDGKKFDFMGIGFYYMLKTHNLSVIAETTACYGPPSCTYSITIKVITNRGTSRTVQLLQELKVLVDGVATPKLPITISNGLITVRALSSTQLGAVFDDGVRITWDGRYVSIDVPPSYWGHTQGLCGTFNSDQGDDFQTPNGTIATSVDTFGNSWRTKNTHIHESGAYAGSVSNQCEWNEDIKVKAVNACGVLKSPVFKDCWSKVDFESHYENCMYDTCACPNGSPECYCPMIEAYAIDCARNGEPIKWRDTVKECRIKCPYPQVYEECGDSCVRSCSDLRLKSTQTCRNTCVSGCRCPVGHVLDDSNKCVATTSCPCVHEGEQFHAGHKIARPSIKGTDLCTCTNANWDCRMATDDEAKLLPSVNCLASNNEEYAECAPIEPMTCSNMHIYERSDDCQPGCVCKMGFVFNVQLKKCVLPADCPCQQGNCAVGTVRKGELCVPSTACTTCVCSGYGQSDFLTYDRQNFAIDGNCTYLLTRIVKPVGGYTFQAYVTLAACDLDGCTKSLHFLHGSNIVNVKHSATSPRKLQITINKATEQLPYKSGWIAVTERFGKGIHIKFVKSHVEVDVQFDDLAFSIEVPSNQHKSTLEGICGDCNGDSRNDIQANPMAMLKSNKLSDILRTWLVDDPKLGVEGHCIKATDVVTSPRCYRMLPEQDLCMIMMRDRVFGQCHPVVEPQSYVTACQAAICATGPNPKTACHYMAAYAQECSQNGICLDWRTNGPCIVNVECSAGMVYKSCGCHTSCEDDQNSLWRDTRNNCPAPLTDGCFCPNDTIPHNGKCVTKAGCRMCDNDGHFVGDVWNPDQCTKCVCQANGQTQCKKHKCPKMNCNRGFHKVAIDEDKDCCPKTICCKDQKSIKCRDDQILKNVIDKDGCKSEKCVCNPEVTKNCEPFGRMTVRPGEQLIVDKSGCCPVQRVLCDDSTCSQIICTEEFYEPVIVEHKSKDLCCDAFICQPSLQNSYQRGYQVSSLS